MQENPLLYKNNMQENLVICPIELACGVKKLKYLKVTLNIFGFNRGVRNCRVFIDLCK